MALTKLKTNAIADDAVTTDKLADAINTARDANTAKVSLADNAVTLAKMAAGTDGQIITYDASGDPVAVGPGTDGQVLTSTGAGSPPAFEALPVSGAALTGSTNNTVVTVTGANAMAGEATFTYDGTNLQQKQTGNTSTSLIFDSNRSAADNEIGGVVGKWDTETVADMRFFTDDDTTNKDNGYVSFRTSTASGSLDETLRLKPNRDVQVTAGNVVISQSGKGIDFSAQAVTDGTGTTPSQTSEVFDHYEMGSWTPDPDTGTLAGGGARYIRIGHLVMLNGYIKVSDTSSSDTVKIGGVPYSVGSQGDAGTGWNGPIRGYNLSSNIGDSTEPENCTISGSDKIEFGAVTNNGGGWAMLGHNEITNSNHAINFTIWYVTDE